MRILARTQLASGLLALLIVVLAAAPTVTATVEIGAPAPDFKLPSTEGGHVSLSSFKGKQVVLLEFYGLDFAPAWAANLSAREADYARFQALGVQVLGISANATFSQRTFAESLKLPYPLLSDFPKLEVIRTYGVLNEATKSTARRSFFVIDRQGVVRHKWVPEDPGALFPSETLLRAVQDVASRP